MAKGVSLIEVILVVMLVGFIVLVLANLPNALSVVGVGRRSAIAREIVYKKIEDLQAQSYSTICDPTPSCTETVIDSRLANLPSASAQALIEECPPAICTNLETIKQATVSVSWIEKGTTKKVETTVLLTEGGI